MPGLAPAGFLTNFHVPDGGVVHRHLAAVPGLGEPGGQNGGLVEALQVGRSPLSPQDDVGAVYLLGVEPDIPLAGQLTGEQIVLAAGRRLT